LDLISQFIVTNLRRSKLLLKFLVTHNMKNVISLKVRILGSNLFLTRLYVDVLFRCHAAYNVFFLFDTVRI
jgi:hypothetical protein